MLVLETEFLMGRYVATTPYERGVGEWPPHPDRLFSALVAAYKECGFGKEEETALQWLEGQPPPAISASEASDRSTVDFYVPVNDSRGLALLPHYRPRQRRTFPCKVPESPVVYFIWRDASDEESRRHWTGLQSLAAAVTYLGHSSSPVRVALVNRAPPPTYVPSDEGAHLLRCVSPGRLHELEDMFRRDQRPLPSRAVRYGNADEQPQKPPDQTVFDEMIVFRKTGGAILPLRAAYRLTATVRQTLIARAEEPVPEVVSGHTADGKPSQEPHVAIVPLANIGHSWADGRLMGFALVLPRELPEADRRHLYRALQRDEGDRQVRLSTIVFGDIGIWEVDRVAGSAHIFSLQTEPYVRQATRWATVTPVVMDRFPKPARGDSAEKLVQQACTRIGLPEPTAVHPVQVSPIRGVPPAGFFARPVAKGYLRRPWHHIVLEFDKPVHGPIILGAGRYLGLGLFRRIDPADVGQ